MTVTLTSAPTAKGTTVTTDLDITAEQPVSVGEAAILARFARRTRKLASDTSHTLSQGTFAVL
jgi:hypothetical protein